MLRGGLDKAQCRHWIPHGVIVKFLQVFFGLFKEAKHLLAGRELASDVSLVDPHDLALVLCPDRFSFKVIETEEVSGQVIYS